MGQGQQGDHAGYLREHVSAPPGLPPGPRRLGPGLLRRRGPALPAAGPGSHRPRVALALRSQYVHPGRTARAHRPRPRFHHHPRPQLPGHPRGRRHQVGGFHPAQPAAQAGADRRHLLRGRDQEVDLHRAERPAAARGRAPDALLGQRGLRRRRRGLLRPLGHRQDDAVGRSVSAPDRRRRARLERRRRLQLRGRLLRQGDPAVGRRPSRRSTPPPGASARSWRTSCWIPIRGSWISTTTA